MNKTFKAIMATSSKAIQASKIQILKLLIFTMNRN